MSDNKIQAKINYAFCATPFGLYRKYGRTLKAASLVYGVLLEYAYEAFFRGENLTPPLSYQDIGENLDMHKETIEKHIRLLAKHDVIKIIEQFQVGVGRIGNAYEILPPSEWKIPENADVPHETRGQKGDGPLGGKFPPRGSEPDKERKLSPQGGGLKTPGIPYGDQLLRSKRSLEDTDVSSSSDGLAPTDQKKSPDSPPKGGKPRKPPKEVKALDADHPAVKLALGLRHRILQVNPSADVPANDLQDKRLQEWARELDRMLRLDERDYETSGAVINFAFRDGFWKNIILSASALRKHFDQLNTKRINGNGKSTPTPTRQGSSLAINTHSRRDEDYGEAGIM